MSGSSESSTVLLVGGSGYVGTHLANRLKEDYKVFATYFKKKISIPGVSFLPLDAADKDWAKRVVYLTKPDVIVYAAGSNDLEWAQDYDKMADRVHAGGPITLLEVADIFRPKVIYLSNNYVFDGKRGNYYDNDILFPPYTLGNVKVNGENFVRAKSLNYIIIRSVPLYGVGNGSHPSFIDKLRTSLDFGERFDLDTQIVHNYASVAGLCDLVANAINSGFKKRIFHYGGPDKMTEYEFGQKFAAHFGYDPLLIGAKKIPEKKSKAFSSDQNIIADYSLNISSTITELKLKPLGLEQGFNLIEKGLV